MTQYILPFKPGMLESGMLVAELGGGSCPRFHPNIDFRKMDGVDIVADFNKGLEIIPDNSYNGLFSNYNLEHLSWRRIRPFLKDVFRILKPGGIAVFVTANLLEQCKEIARRGDLDDSLICMIMGGQKFGKDNDLNEIDEELEESWDMNSHHAGWSPSYIDKVLRNIGFNKVNLIPIETVHGITDMIIECSKPEDKSMKDSDSCSIKSIELKEVSNESISNESISNESMVKINVGSFTVMNKDGWINIDNQNLLDYANSGGFLFRQIDVVTSGLPYQDGSVDLISSSHFLEHIDRVQGRKFLEECLRVMKVGGIIRLTVPDTQIICKDYLDGNIEIKHAGHNTDVQNSPDLAESLFILLLSGHKTVYDFNSLKKILKDVGFVEIEKMEYGKSKSKVIETENKDLFPELSLYVEASKCDKIKDENRDSRGIEQKDEKREQPTGPIITYGITGQIINQTTNILSIKDKHKPEYELKIHLDCDEYANFKKEVEHIIKELNISVPFIKEIESNMTKNI